MSCYVRHDLDYDRLNVLKTLCVGFRKLIDATTDAERKARLDACYWRASGALHLERKNLDLQRLEQTREVVAQLGMRLATFDGQPVA